MAKKKSRNVRKQSSTKLKRRRDVTPNKDVPKKLEEQQPLPVSVVIPEEPTTVKVKLEVAPSLDTRDTKNTTTSDFAQDYFYIYSELRNILIITVIMFAVLAGMSFMI